MLEKECRAIRQTMQETGSGNRTTQAELDALDENDERRSAWGAILADAPWYFQMRDIIGERPNHEPVALGNSTSEDMMLVGGRSASSPSVEGAGIPWPATPGVPPIDYGEDNEEVDPTPPAGRKRARTSSSAFSRALDVSSDSDNSDEEQITSGKSKAASKGKGKSMAVASMPAAAIQPPAKKGKITELASVAIAEEHTRAKQLDLAAKDADVELAKFQTEAVIAKEVSGPKAQAVLVREQRKNADAEFHRKMQLLEACAKYGEDAVARMFGLEVVPAGAGSS
ncbi:hypothetical protein GGX14DRAFT_410034, partial [Mycena pura]